jgi:hypothetical protein
MANELVSEVERWLNTLYIRAEGAGLRVEDRRKAAEVAAVIVEIGRIAGRLSSRSEIVLVDAAAGKSYVGLLAAKLVLEPLGRRAAVVTIERDPRKAGLSRDAAARLQTPVPIECRSADVADLDAWPRCASIVVALHACGPAADEIIEQVIRTEAKALLLAPCCTSASVPAAARAQDRAGRLGFPHHAPVRRRFIQAAVDAERTLRLEAAGYETEVVEFVAATITPHNLLWRSRRVCEPSRMEAARRMLETHTEPRA